MSETETRHITIIGLGLIGGSMGLALKRAGLPNIEIVGSDIDRSAERGAKKAGAIDRDEHSIEKAVTGASMVIVATPISAVREVFTEIAPHLMEGAIVTDTASTKGDVMKWASELLPDTINFIGGHPMAGKETGGIENAEANLFDGRAYCICPTVESSHQAVKSVMGLADLIGAEPMFIDADEHDVYAAAISHLPLVTATAMFNLMRESPSWDDLGVLASSGFRDMTRLASGDPAMSNAIWTTNRESIIHWIDRLAGELTRMRDMLSDARDEELFKIFATTKLQRDQFIAEPPRRQRPASGPELDRSKAFLDVMVGGMMADNIRRAGKMPDMIGEKYDEETPEGGKRKVSMADKVGEAIRRDLEELERKREEKAKRKEGK